MYLSGGQLKPTDRAMAARSARKSSTGCSSCCEEEREDRKRFIGMRGHRKTLLFQLQKDLKVTLVE